MRTLRDALKSQAVNIPGRQRNDLKKIAAAVSGFVSKNLVIKRYYAKFANTEHTQEEVNQSNRFTSS